MKKTTSKTNHSAFVLTTPGGQLEYPRIQEAYTDMIELVLKHYRLSDVHIRDTQNNILVTFDATNTSVCPPTKKRSKSSKKNGKTVRSARSGSGAKK